MHYLVDGHNLIGQMPNIELSDPEDEDKLIALLHRWTLRHPKDRVTVIFDRGGYGHPARRNPERVEVIFARSPSDADTRLAQRLSGITSPRRYTLVSADRVVVEIAEALGVAVKPSAVFAAELNAPAPVARQRPTRRRARPEPKLPRTDVDAWLRAFGADKE